jgi:SpoVK/Ycf46/Vps4 family AAA+-type ATPase
VTKKYFSSSTEHILAELSRIDYLLRVYVSLARQIQVTDGQFQGLYISEQEVDGLLKSPIGLPGWATMLTPQSIDEVQTTFEQMTTDIGDSKIESQRRGIVMRLDELAQRFNLDSFDVDILIVCLASEFDLRYERLYAYLQDDVTKKRPSVDLVLNLLSPSFEVKLAARKHFSTSAPLFKYHLLHLFEDPSHQKPPLLSKFLKVDERVVEYLNGSDDLDPYLTPYMERINNQHRLEDLVLPDDLKRRLARLVFDKRKNGQKMTLYFQGPYGVGKKSTAQALCHESGLNLLTVRLNEISAGESLNFGMAIRLAGREALLQQAALYWSGFDTLLIGEKRSLLTTFLDELEQQPGVTFLDGKKPWEPRAKLHHTVFTRIGFPQPNSAQRLQMWATALDDHCTIERSIELSAVANKFRFSGGQIMDAVATARNLSLWRDPENRHVSSDDLHAACRLQSNRKLAELSQKIIPYYTWQDIVLPSDCLDQLREICNYVKYRSLVYDQWGFDQKLSTGKGLNILFSGPSGTGKTMAAEIMANELGLDLYKIDLSTLVSKYIGETEKNLGRVFAEAESSNAILFFDEADALFGRRSEVRDSHDRYANIETSYLLQKMEEYEGVVILATNLRKNMDEAFTRRIHFTVNFPFPEVNDRRRIWEQIWPENMPRNSDIDMKFLANRFEVAGGNIRNIALAAAFLAADDGQVVNMNHLIHATRREYQKLGKLVTEGEFIE